MEVNAKVAQRTKLLTLIEAAGYKAGDFGWDPAKERDGWLRGGAQDIARALDRTDDAVREVSRIASDENIGRLIRRAATLSEYAGLDIGEGAVGAAVNKRHFARQLRAIAREARTFAANAVEVVATLEGRLA